MKLIDKLLLKPGGASRDRTGDLLHAMQALSQLSYSPASKASHFIRADLGCQAAYRASVAQCVKIISHCNQCQHNEGGKQRKQYRAFQHIALTVVQIDHRRQQGQQ